MTTDQIFLAILANRVTSQHQTIERMDSMLSKLMHRTDALSDIVWQMDRREKAVAQIRNVASPNQTKSRRTARKTTTTRRAGKRA